MSFHEEVLRIFEALTKKPENYVSVQNNVADNIKKFLKSLYDHTKIAEELPSVTALPELIIDNFDEEQIWQEIELQNEEQNNVLLRNVSHLLASRNNLVLSVDQPCDDSKLSDNEVEDDDRTDGSDSEDAQVPQESVQKKTKRLRLSKKTKKGKSSIVDDRFFKLNELSNFLDREDRKINNEIKKARIAQSSESESDDESFDYFQDISSEEDKEDEAELHYADFFDAPEDLCEEGNDSDGYESNKINGGGSEENSEEESNKSIADELSGNEKQKKRVRFESVESDNAEESGSGDFSDNASVESSEGTKVKSSFETRQERLKSRIDELESKALSEKPWQLKGEVSAATRPQNSLLEEALEFDLTTRPAPVITEETTLKLEDIIRQRIKDKSWDDVERKIKPVETPFEYKKKLVLNQEKSKLSLAEVYEQEYLKQRESLNPEADEKPEEEPKEHIEIKKMMSSLFVKLDALSNFHYTPKPVAPDIQIVSNLPAITIEEVAPVGVSEAALLAPEEVKAKKKEELMSKQERTETDKKRERRQKKARQRERRLERENKKKLVEKLRPGLGNKYSKQKALKMLEKATKEKNVTLFEEKSKTIKSSKAFFNQLQEEVDTHIKTKLKSVKKKNNERFMSAKKIKL